MPTLTWRQAAAAVVPLALGTVGVLGALLLPTSAAPGDLARTTPTDGANAEQRLHPVGDGSLPDSAPALRAPHEPLSSAERGYAFHLAREAAPADARDVAGGPGGELLAADLPPLPDRTASRRVVVWLYDYAADELHQVLLDLTHRTVVDDRSTQGLQPPPTEAETAAALELAIQARPAPAFVRQYRRLGGPLLTPDQVTAVAGVWRPVDASLAPTATDVCGRHRCLQLLVALPTGDYLDTHDIVVDLSARSVLRTDLGGPDDAR